VTSGAAAGFAAVVCIQTDGWMCPTAAVILAAAVFYYLPAAELIQLGLTSVGGHLK
jgi:hypothetical protein